MMESLLPTYARIGRLRPEEREELLRCLLDGCTRTRLLNKLSEIEARREAEAWEKDERFDKAPTAHSIPYPREGRKEAWET